MTAYGTATVYLDPQPDHYVIGAHLAEGNPIAGDSAATVLDATAWEEVASLALKAEPTVFAGYLDQSVVMRGPDTVGQLGSLEASALRAPEGLHDDHADSFALTVVALADPTVHAQPSKALPTVDPLAVLVAPLCESPDNANGLREK